MSSDAMPLNKQLEPLDWAKLERLDWHLWLLASLLIFVLGVGLLSFMVPAAFWFIDPASARAPERAFFGFCVLLGLVIVYLLQRQAAVRDLKRRLFEAESAKAAAEQHAAAEAFLSLPGLVQFRDALAMEFRRASTSGTHLSEVIFKVATGSPQVLGRMAQLLRGTLRRGETLYQLSEHAIGVILPGMQLSEAGYFAAQLGQLSGMANGELQASVSAYPDEASSLAELDAKLRGLIDRAAN